MTVSIRSPKTERPDAMRGHRKKLTGPTMMVVFAVLGVGVLLYPSAAQWLSALDQSQHVDGYSTAVEHLGPDGRTEAIEAAHEYNSDLLSGGAVYDAFSSRPEGQESDAERYAEMLSLGPGDAMSRIRIPNIDVDLPIYHGTSDATLRRGVGHIMGTALPVGGEGTHSVLTAHRGLPEATLFTNLDRVTEGDEFQLEVYGELLYYRVFDTKVVEPDETEDLFPVEGEDLVTLVTCTPLGINSQRILVTGERVPGPNPPPESGADSEGPGLPWAFLAFGGTVVAGGVYLYMTGRRAK